MPPPAFWLLSTDTDPNTAVESYWYVEVLYFRPISLIQHCMKQEKTATRGRVSESKCQYASTMLLFPMRRFARVPLMEHGCSREELLFAFPTIMMLRKSHYVYRISSINKATRRPVLSIV